MSSTRKPYLRLKKSMVDFFRAPAVFIKNMNQKFSAFEKPYLDSEYQQMHLNWPSWDWGNWSWKRPLSRPLPLTTGPFGSRKGRYDCVLSCWYESCDDPVECFIMIESGPAPGLGAFSVSGDVLGSSGGGFADIDIAVDNSVETARIRVKYVDFEGNTCFRDVEIDCEVCDPAATIGYTTLGMQVDEEQTFTTSLPGTYTWVVASGEGSMDGATYTAPSSNAECADNPTINLLCDGVVIDSITLAINAKTGTTPASSVVGTCIWENPCDYTPNTCVAWCANTYCACIPVYQCDGTYISGSSNCCRHATICATACGPGTYTDLRSAQMITDGCCPELAL